MTTKYPYHDAEGNLVYACCVSAIGPKCQHTAEPVECIDNYLDTCEGAVEYRMALSGTGISYPRCDKHWSVRLDAEEKLRERYPVMQPSDFDPSYAGERWDEDY